MGSMFEAQCPCGYASDTLLEGCGMAGPDTYRDLARCEHCREIVLRSIRSSSARRRCPKCRRVAQIITIEQQPLFDAKPIAGHMNLERPRCGNWTMAVTQGGHWD